MLTFIVGDLHIDPSSSISQPTEDGLTTYLQELDNFFEWLVREAVTRKPGRMVLLGDVFDTSSQIDARALKVASRGLLWLSREVPELRVLVGNHDITNPFVNSLSILQGCVIDKPVIHGDALYLPYGDDVEAVRSFLKTLAGPVRYVFSHVPTMGGVFNDRHQETRGLWEVDFQHLGLPWIVVGHYHRPSLLPGPGTRSRVVFAGAAHARTFSDSLDASKPIRHRIVMMEDGPDGPRWGFLDNPHTTIFRKLSITNEIGLDSLTELASSQEAPRTALRVTCGPEHRDAVLQHTDKFRYLETVLMIEERPQTGTNSAPIELERNPRKRLEAHLRVAPPADLRAEDLLKVAEAFLTGETARPRVDVQFDHLLARNFLSLGEVALKLTPGLRMVDGVNLDDTGSQSNGSGKSSIFEALYWVLFGKTLRGLTGDAVIREGEKSVTVRLDLVAGGVACTVERYRGHPKLGNGLLILRGRVDVSPRKATEGQQVLDDLVGLNETTFRQLFFMTQGLESRLSDLGDVERKRFIEGIARLDEYDAIHVQVHAAVRGHEVDLEVNTRLLASIRDVRSRAERDLAVRQGELASFQAWADGQRFCLEDEVRTHEAALLGRQHSIALVENRITETAAGEDRHLIDMEAANQEIVATSERRATLTHEIRTCRQTLADADAVLKRGECPTCRQGVSGSTYLRETAGTLPERIRDAEQELAGHETTLRAATERKTASETNLRAVRSTVQDFRRAVRESQQEIERILRQQSDCRLHLSGLEGKRLVIQEAIQMLETGVQKADLDAVAVEAAMRDAGVQIQHLRCLMGMFAPDGPIRANALREIIRFMNERLSLYSKQLLGDREVVLDATTNLKSGKQAEKISIRIAKGRDYAALSSGERRRVDLALQLSLNDLAEVGSCLSSNLLVCDEIDDKLDEKGLESLAEILKEKSESGKSIFLVTQHSFLKSLIPTILTVTKQKGVSSIKIA